MLADGTYEPVNELSGFDRDRVIIRDYPLLRDDLATLLRDGRSVPLILIKFFHRMPGTGCLAP